MSNEIKRCPFCNSEVSLYTFTVGSQDIYMPHCSTIDCIAGEDGVGCSSKEEAINIWEKRVGDGKKLGTGARDLLSVLMEKQKTMGANERVDFWLEIRSGYCNYCGRTDPDEMCQCYNDE